MINTQIRTHDKYAVEFKIGFHVSDKKIKDSNRFKINTWIFLPNGLDINRHTYHKEQFYSDIKTNVRLITPIYSLDELLNPKRGPFPRLQKAIDELTVNPNETSAEDYLYHIKLLLSILKSAYRDCAGVILRTDSEREQAVIRFVGQVEEINRRYRAMRDAILDNEALSREQKNYALFGDEFLGFITEDNGYLILNRTEKSQALSGEAKQAILRLIRREGENKKAMGYTLPDENDEEHNSLMLIKKSVLKKFVESDLYLQRLKKADGIMAREFYYSIAAGAAMVFATVVSFAATQKLGSFTTSLFLVLVISYMFKDRIKETFRIYFSSKLDKKYFDWKWNVSINNSKIGYIKEAFDFISQDKVPQEIMNLRKKTPLVEAENEIYDEKVILYRKRVSISKKELEEDKQYHFPGVNDIIRFNLDSFTKKMDNPEIPIYLAGGEKGYHTITGNRAYALHFIIESQSEQETSYKAYRVLFNRNGISDITEV